MNYRYHQLQQILAIMSQLFDYLASVFAAKSGSPPGKANNHVTFSDNSFTQVFAKGESERANKLASLSQSNWRTIYSYLFIGALAFLFHLSLVTVPKVQLEDFDLMKPDGWQHVTLSLVPFLVYLASIGAMIEVNKPLAEGAKLSAKNSGLDLNNNDFVHSLKIIIVLMAICQLSSIFSHQLIWSVVMIVPLWCYQLTSRMAQSEYKRYSPGPKKQWVRLNLPKSPKTPTPAKQSPAKPVKQEDAQVKATPRTRTRRAVKNLMTGVSDKYHAFEQNVAHQLSQKIFQPLSPKLKMIE